VTTRSQAVLWAVRHGCVTEPSAYQTTAVTIDEPRDVVREAGYPA
jgi:hypothetical protein